MVYEMKLNQAPFEKIRSGSKTVELRLYDEKRRKLEIGDEIIFTRLPDKQEKTAVRVKGLLRFASFEDLFGIVSPERCGNEDGTSKAEAALGMRKYYSEEQEKRYGVVGIYVSVIDFEERGDIICPDICPEANHIHWDYKCDCLKKLRKLSKNCK